MLKRILFLLSLASLFSFGFLLKTPSYVHSQEPPTVDEAQTFDEAYSEYIKFSEDYSNAHEDYVLKRAQYIRFQTLKSRQDAFDATLKMLTSRDAVVISYLGILKAKTNFALGVSDIRRESILLSLEEEIAWFTDHKANIPSSGSLEDLVSDSNLAESRWDNVEQLAYIVMSNLSLGKVLVFADRTKEVFDDTKTKLETIRLDEREEFKFSADKFSILDRWMLEAGGRIARSGERLTNAEELIEGMTNKRKDFQVEHNSVISELSESQIFLKETTSFVKEIIKQIKTAEE
jgi:hypothetical protein